MTTLELMDKELDVFEVNPEEWSGVSYKVGPLFFVYLPIIAINNI
jgi:hypothetical protein